MASAVSKRDAKAMQLTRLIGMIRGGRATAENAHLVYWNAEARKLWSEYSELHDAVISQVGDDAAADHHEIYNVTYELYSEAGVELQLLKQVLEKEDPARDSEARQLDASHALAIVRLNNECAYWLQGEKKLTMPEIRRATEAIEHLIAHMRAIGEERVLKRANVAEVSKAEEEVFEQFRLVCVKLDAHQLRICAADAAAVAETANSAAGVGAAGGADAFRKPVLNIAPFNGAFDKWESFRDSFEFGIHRRTGMSNVEKLIALKGLLRGGPELLIRNLNLTDANYATAWALITRRYSHRRELLFSHYRVIFELPNCTGSANELTNISNTMLSTLAAVDNMGEPVDQLDSWVVFIVSEKLDKVSRSLWEQQIAASDDIPTWDELDRFIQGRVRALSVSSTTVQSRGPSNQSAKESGAKGKRVFSHAVKVTKHAGGRTNDEGSAQVCGYCHNQHLITFCAQFKRLPVAERRSAVASRGLCFVCMSDAHKANACTSTRRCFECGQRHNTMLHTAPGAGGRAQAVSVQPSGVQAVPVPVVPGVAQAAQPTTSAAAEAEHQVAAHTATHDVSNVCRTTNVLLATAVIKVRDVNGESHLLRTLLDQGSEVSFVSERAVQMLQLQRRSETGEIVGLGGAPAGRAKQSVMLSVADRFDNGFSTDVRALIIPKISERPKVASVRVGELWAHLKDVQLADPEATSGGRIDVLLGSDVYGLLLRDGLDCRVGVPTAQNTSLGWVLSGKVNSPTQEQVVQTHHLAVDDQLAKFWELEEPPARRIVSDADEKCEAYFAKTVRRDSIGRLHVRLPLNVECVTFGETQRYAVQRQLQIERKFRTNATYADMYRAFMSEYETLGHMRKIDGAEVDLTRTRAMQSVKRDVYYIPHHAVLKESSTTTKLRVVFDASRRSTNGVSLNDVMLTGPKLQDDLTATMMSWRMFRVAYCADVQRMYRQIVVDPPDTAMQRIVWRADSDCPLEVYELTTVTYGTASAPYLAIKSLQTLAEMERERFPIGAEIALRHFYVDDVLCGGDDDSDCVQGQRQIIGLLESGGMSLRKWASNSEVVLAQVDEAHRDCSLPLDIHDDSSISTLGIQWHPGADTLGFKVDIAGEVSGWTKRSFLSAASRLFDPLGWLAPCIISVKMLFQTLWKHKLDWDDPLPAELSLKWEEMRHQLHRLGDIRIDRWIGSMRGSCFELHGFCDASLGAYAAVVYARICDGDGNIRVHNLCAKSKVAPVKVVSLPRLELCGAALLVKLVANVQRAMRLEEVSVHCWTDSTIVLGWLNSHASQFTVFVANRTAEIQRNVPAERWRHVPSGDNPADCVSRGITAEQLVNHSLWWSGPMWLKADDSAWPAQPAVLAATDEIRTRANYVEHVVGTELLSRYSTLRRLMRITAWCLRFLNNCRVRGYDKARRMREPLSPAEHQRASDSWVRVSQSNAFAEELRQVRAKKSVAKGSKLRSLNPFVTPDGIMRVGGRLVNAMELTDAARCPAIIPRRSELSRLIVQDAHARTLHGGPMLMLAQIRRQYWVIDGPNEVRQHVQKCTTCFRHTARPTTQLMGALPAARVTPSRPFLHCALDYSGAIMVRSARGRGQHATKAYFAVFVCLATKAVHVELAGDLTTAAFIAAYERFTARRGICSDLYSDNATNFVGAAKIFMRTERAIFGSEVMAAMTTRGTTWHFAPPLSPHFNGLAESAIRSVKHHLKRVVGEATLTFEELSTVLAKVEAILNSRPLYPLSSDPSNFDALTPAHFLIGEATGVIPQRDHTDANIPLVRRWELAQQMVQRVWRRWSADYLHTLQQRHKWQRPQPDLAVNDLVLLLDDNLPPGKWSLGRVIEVHPGDDGFVRVATVRTRGGVFKRAVVRMAKLPNQTEQTEQLDPIDESV